MHKAKMSEAADNLFDDRRHFRRDCMDLRKLLEFGGVLPPQVVDGLIKKLGVKMSNPEITDRAFQAGWRTMLAAAKVEIEVQKLELLK